MECRMCRVIKLPNEFAPENVTEECEHPSLFCLRCTVKTVKETSTCPYQGCGQKVQLTDKKIRWFQAILDDMFKEYDAGDHEDFDSQSVPNSLLAGGIITISVLTGESMAVPYDPNLQVLQLKMQISETMDHPVDKQKLLYMDKELASYKKDGMPARLLDYSVKPNATLCLVIVLFSVPDNFDNVVFDLFWGYPLGRRDYLDASCLMFKGTHCQSICDYSKSNPVKAIRHSGDVMDDVKEIGHHTINVSLKSLPTDITHLFFTLSAWSSPNISRYPNPSLKFHEMSNPTKDLCKTTFHHAGASQAVVMCSVSRGSHGRWEIFESGKLSAGNARDYKPLQTTIQSLITQGF
ncbi:uncharacterized protein LOC132748655 [Ruditapes philippinarum]|uniref:uncharacterized protein LOC132748655 n=1 Tax=Ruditapes philippinarum TaxID=129788 RepID=UPI00295B9D77|nr:uncharacterized protein LOC132748655 [Ruditapes philippinarum]